MLLESTAQIRKLKCANSQMDFQLNFSKKGKKAVYLIEDTFTS